MGRPFAWSSWKGRQTAVEERSVFPERGGGGVLPYVSHVGMCGPKGNAFWAILVWKGV